MQLIVGNPRLHGQRLVFELNQSAQLLANQQVPAVLILGRLILVLQVRLAHERAQSLNVHQRPVLQAGAVSATTKALKQGEPLPCEVCHRPSTLSRSWPLSPASWQQPWSPFCPSSWSPSWQQRPCPCAWAAQRINYDYAVLGTTDLVLRVLAARATHIVVAVVVFVQRSL